MVNEPTIDLEVGAPVHGGHCLARHEGRIVFVRHALPGERVRVLLTEAGDKGYWRGDAVEVLDASADRVPSVWPAAGPGGVGGGELAHVRLPAQRLWKRDAVLDALHRIGKLTDHPALEGFTVEAVPGDDVRGGLGTRTRIELVADGEGRAGMFAARSHDVIPLTCMPLAAEPIRAAGLFERSWRPGSRLHAVAPSDGDVLVLADGDEVRGGRRKVRERVTLERTYDYRVAGAGFWQIHLGAPELLARAALAAAALEPGQRVLDLYSGAGLFTAPLADAVGEAGTVHAVEGDPQAVRDARRNAHGLPQVRLHEGQVAQVLAAVCPVADVVVLDPPRAGAGRRVMEQVLAGRPDRVVYVACDPAALARDIATARTIGYELESLRGFDLFPHTHHVECLAVLTPAAAP